MGFLDGLIDVLDVVTNVASEISNELSKDTVQDIVDWINDCQEEGVTSIRLNRKNGDGLASVSASAFNAKGKVITTASWTIECNTGAKAFFKGDPSGLWKIFDEGSEKEYILNENNDDDDNDDLFYISLNYKQEGPFTRNELILMYEDGSLTHEHYINKKGTSDWINVSEFVGEDNIDLDYEYENKNILYCSNCGKKLKEGAIKLC